MLPQSSAPDQFLAAPRLDRIAGRSQRCVQSRLCVRDAICRLCPTSRP